MRLAGFALVSWITTATPGMAAAAFQTAEDAARAELEEGQGQLAKGQYLRAQRTYEKLAERYPATEAGRVAARRSRPNALLGWGDLLRHGPSTNRVDVVVMGDGYPLKKQGAFDDVAADVPREFERDSVFGEYFRYLNFVKANVVSAEDGLDGHGREASTALGARVIAAANVPHVAVDAEIVRGMLDLMPAQDGYAIVFVPLGTLGTGGGGVATVGGRNPRTMIHEWGHAFVGLGDEYAVYTGLHAGVSDGINVAASDDPERVPWVHFIAAGVPGVGVYEGANGQVRGAWRPTASGCRMNDGEFFCPVCREALILRIHEHVDPIDEARVRSSPGIPPEGELGGEDPHEFEVVVLRPDSHVLEVSWWILSAEDAPAPRDHTARPRTLRGPLAALTAKPAKRARSSRNGVHRFRVSPRQLDPGRYRVVCRVRDTTQLRGKRFPWVLRDERGLLESERGWWIEVED